jgi:Abnormal spindle-like microcephaly-assoc'd, ASPM-SPD-2-Hydin
LKNTGSGAMQVKSIVISGTNKTDFSETNGCGTSLAAGTSCTVHVVFKPTEAGTRAARVDISSNAGDGMDSVTLTGSASATSGTPILSIPKVSLEFETTKTGLSAQLEISLKNVGTADLKLGKINVKQGDHFGIVTNTCGVTLAPGQTCSIKVAFQPKTPGEHIDDLEISNDSDGTTELVELKGQAAAADAGGTPTTNSSGGGGCAMAVNGAADMALIMLFLLSGLGLVLRKRQK